MIQQMGPPIFGNNMFVIGSQAAVVVLVLLGVNYLYSCFLFRNAMLAKRRGENVAPPAVPDFVPRFGHAVGMVWNPTELVKKVIHFASPDAQNPVRLDVGPKSLYVIQGAKNIRTLWKRSSSLSSSGNSYWPLKTLFGMAEKSARRYLLENCVIESKDESSDMMAQNRIGYTNHHIIAKFLTGPALNRLWLRYERELGHFFSQNIEFESNEWKQYDDFTNLFTVDFTRLSLRALVGPILLQIDPDFPRRFQDYSYALPTLLRGLPRWLSPSAYQVRDSLIASVKKWHDIARAQFTPDSVGPDGDEDPYWGCEFFRKRQEALGKAHEYDYDALASEDFGFLYGAHHNVTFASFWVAREIFNDPTILARVREEIQSCKSASTPTGFDAEKLCKVPLLQSIWAETMRLRVHIFNTRNTQNEDVNVNNWIIPKNSTVFLASTPAHFDRSEWNTGRNDEYPLDTFWAERFMRYPDDPFSGPLRQSQAGQKMPLDFGEKPYYHFDASMSGSWIPFGGGPYKCPGRHFAKREALMLSALLVDRFDVRFEEAGAKELKMDWRTCGLGTLKPDRKIRYSIRKRRFDSR